MATKIFVRNEETGDVRSFPKDCKIMVAPNGVIFVKKGSSVLFASGSTNITVFEADEDMVK